MSITTVCDTDKLQFCLCLEGHFCPPSQVKAKSFRLEEKKPQFGVKNVFNPEHFNNKVQQLRKNNLTLKTGNR
jgi:hypothetical protein